jgi:phytoene dehydrogenase-like protein
MQDPIDTGFQPDAIIVGGGLAGLIAANLIARAGRSVSLLERSSELGGRAATHVERDIHFNLGPHALYCRGRAFRVFQELGISFSGGFPRARGGLLIAGDTTFPLPRGFRELLFSRLFSLREKMTAVKILGALGRWDTRLLDGVPLTEWIEQAAGRGNLARFFRTLFRVSTYIDDADRMSAGVALDQLKLALQGNVWYLDGGWRTLVDGLRKSAVERGARLQTGSRVSSVHRGADGVTLRLSGGEELRGRAAVLAVDPETACDLLDLPADASLVPWSAACIPVRAACLDVALTGLPRPDLCVAFGLDRPLYYSVHSASADLAPPNVAVLHVMKYLGTEMVTHTKDIEAELEGLLDRLQPGWRARTVTRRFLPAMTVAHSFPLAEDGGLRGRPEVVVPGSTNVFLAGDWVGPEGLLADASAVSAWEAAARVLAALSTTPVAGEGRFAHAPD